MKIHATVLLLLVATRIPFGAAGFPERAMGSAPDATALDPCVGCALQLVALDANGNETTIPTYVTISVNWGNSTSGLCLGEAPPCTPSPCTIDGSGGNTPTITITFKGGAPVTWYESYPGAVRVIPGNPIIFAPPLGAMQCGSGRYMAFYSDSTLLTPVFSVGFKCKDLCPQ